MRPGWSTPAAVTDLKTKLEVLLCRACKAALGDEVGDVDPLVRPAKDARFGDYQANLAMPLAKRLGKKPRELAQAIAEQAGSHAEFGKVEVAGPGFINVTLADSWLCELIETLGRDERLGVVPQEPEKIVIDYSSPNLAKEMHIGHLRSTIIGDCIARVLGFLGHDVTRHNHLGDWGTQFGMLLEYLIDTEWQQASDQSIGDLNQLYQEASQRFKADPEFADRARARVVSLQGGDEQSMSLWRALIGESVRHMNAVYERLGVLLEDADIRPESAYNAALPKVLTDLDQAGVLRESDGARVVFPDGFKNRQGDPLPLIVQKKDGGYGYATTDLAAARYRAGDLAATRLVYVVGAPQSDHFQMVFWTLRKVGWVADHVRLEHVPFGTILGHDNKPFRTREGTSVSLTGVLDEAVERARGVSKGKEQELTASEREDIARAVGIGAVKYADLSSDRIKDYVFDWNRMLSLEGNSAPYIMNAYVRIRSIFRKGGFDFDTFQAPSIRVTHPVERELMLKLLQFPEVLRQVGETLEPHKICGFLYELSSLFHRFFEHCPVLRETGDVQQSRLGLVQITGKTLRLGLELLGLSAVERM